MRRAQKVAKVLKKELAPLIEETLNHEFGLVTLTDVEVQNDLKEARVYVSCFESGSKEAVLKILGAKTPEFQHILGRRLKMRFTPRLTFKEERGLDNVEKIEKLLEEINTEKGK